MALVRSLSKKEEGTYKKYVKCDYSMREICIDSRRKDSLRTWKRNWDIEVEEVEKFISKTNKAGFKRKQIAALPTIHTHISARLLSN